MGKKVIVFAKRPRWVWLPRKYSKLPLTNWQSPLVYKCRRRPNFFSLFLLTFQPRRRVLSASAEVFESDCLSSTMKKSGLFAASVTAASATAISASSSSPSSSSSSNFQFSKEVKSFELNSGSFSFTLCFRWKLGFSSFFLFLEIFFVPFEFCPVRLPRNNDQEFMISIVKFTNFKILFHFGFFLGIISIWSFWFSGLSLSHEILKYF